jgi:hypothetical protein
MPEPVGHGPHVDARREQLGGHEVAEVVQPNLREAGLGSESLPPPADKFGPPGSGRRRIAGEDESLEILSLVDLSCILRRSLVVAGQRLDGLGGDRHPPDAAALRRLDEDSGTRGRDGALDADTPLIEVDVSPSQPADLTAASAGGGGHVEPARHRWVLSGGVGDEGADVGRIRWADR